MDITTTYKVILYIGIVLRCSFYHVGAANGNIFKIPEMVEWSQAEPTCQKNNGKLFKPNETSFDVSLFSECNFNDALWVAATYINIIQVGYIFREDAFIMCEMCQTDYRCGITCLYKACENKCNILCKSLLEPHNNLGTYRYYSWKEATTWCSENTCELGDKMQTTSFLSGFCYPMCIWTKKVITVQLQTEQAEGNEPDECGILHNGTLSFTSCNRTLQPLCERVAMTALETPRNYFSKRNNSFILLNTKTTPMTSTQRTNLIHSTIITTSSKYGTSSVANDIEDRTAIIQKEENTSLLVPAGVAPSKNDIEDSAKQSDTSIIIGAVVGGAVFLMLTVLGIICVRRKLLKRPFHSKQESKHMDMHKTNTIHKPISHFQRQDAPLESDYGLTPFAESESKCVESRSGIVGPKSNPGKSAFTIDPEGSNFIYETVAKKVNVNSSNLAYKINDDTYDHLNDIQQSRYDNVAVNLYDKTNFDQKNDNTYDICGEHRTTPDEGVGLYDRVNNTICSEYETTADLRRDSNAAYDHI